MIDVILSRWLQRLPSISATMTAAFATPSHRFDSVNPELQTAPPRPRHWGLGG